MPKTYKAAESHWLPLRDALACSGTFEEQFLLTKARIEQRVGAHLSYSRPDRSVCLVLSGGGDKVEVVSELIHFGDEVARQSGHASPDDHDWLAAEAGSLVARLKSALLRDLSVGALVAFGRLGALGVALETIPLDLWLNDAATDWERGNVKLLDGSTIFSVHIVPPKGLERVASIPSRSGLAGRPAIFDPCVRPLFLASCRLSQGRLGVRAMAKQLSELHNRQHPTVPMRPKSIENRIRGDLRAWREYAQRAGQFDLNLAATKSDYGLLGEATAYENACRAHDQIVREILAASGD